MTQRPIRILDLDNCIADDGWRLHYIDQRTPDTLHRYHKYHSLSPWDECRNRHLFDFGAFDGRVVIFTARPVLYRELTQEWLQRARVPYAYLLMRNEHHSFRPSPLAKSDMLDHLLNPNNDYGVNYSDIECCYDDRLDVVQMFRARGLKAEVKCIHNIAAYEPKERSA